MKHIELKISKKGYFFANGKRISRAKYCYYSDAAIVTECIISRNGEQIKTVRV
jgi:hypothetical protein